MNSLLLDLGNTRLKWALSRQGRLLEETAGAVAGTPPDLPLIAWRTQALDQVVAASVAPDPVVEDLLQRLRGELGLPVLRIRTRRRWRDLENAYRQPGDLGVDRWLGLIAARSSHPDQALVLVSAGTAMTVDALAADGRHLGGVIAPGLTAMRQGLLAAAPGLKRHGDGREHDDWAIASDDAMAGGCLQAALGLVERARRRLGHDGESLTVLAGGDAPRLLPWLTGPVRHRPHLVLEGLARCADEPDDGVDTHQHGRAG